MEYQKILYKNCFISLDGIIIGKKVKRYCQEGKHVGLGLRRKCCSEYYQFQGTCYCNSDYCNGSGKIFCSDFLKWMSSIGVFILFVFQKYLSQEYGAI